MKKTDLIETISAHIQTLEFLVAALKHPEPKPTPPAPRRRGRKPRPLPAEEISAGFAKIRRSLA